MNTPPRFKYAASLVFLALLTCVNSALATLTVTTENQIGTAGSGPFTPSWVITPSTSLINGLIPSATAGNFNVENQAGTRDVNSLTVNTNLTLTKIAGTTSPNYVTWGNGGSAGLLLVYTLPVGPANGYNITNITVYGGWADNGRDEQAYTVLYSTVAAPDSFIVLGSVAYIPSGVPGGTPSATRVMFKDSSGGLIAGNVAALKFVLNLPNTTLNGYSGYAAITVGGSAAASIVSPAISITTSNQTGANPYTPTWVLELPNLITNMAPLSAIGNFTLEGAAGTPILTDGAIGASGDLTGFATCGGNGGSGNTLIYALTNSPNGSDVTNIVTYSGWANNGRDGQYYIVSYSTVSAPTTYIPITTVYYRPTVAGGIASANRVAIAMNDGSPLAVGVANVRFDFSGPPSAFDFNNGYQGYSEMVVQGKDSINIPPPILNQDTLPTYVETVVGDAITFTALFSNSPPVNLQWQVITTNGVTVTNDIAGATTGTLVLNNLQLTASASFYRLRAVNASDSSKVSYSTPSPLVVTSVPAAVNNIIVERSGQRGLGFGGLSTNFFPTWTLDTNSDLILGATPVPGPGNFGNGVTGSDPILLTDGTNGFLNYWPNVGGSPALVTLGDGGGKSVTYTLPPSTFGYDITNIAVYGGWGDGGRDEQKYEVLYSVDGSTFIHLVTVDYNPSGVPANIQSATRTVLIPGTTNGMVRNVVALEFNFATGSENGYSGYSEIIVGGKQSPPIPTILQDVSPATAVTVVGDHLSLSASFSGADTYQWQKNGTNVSNGPNVSGATTPNLILSNLQTTDTATNSGYRLAASNSSGTAFSTACGLTVSDLPAATNNVIVAIAGQIRPGTAYTPDWTINTANDLIFQIAPSSTGGNFNLEPFGTTRDVANLTDGGTLEVDLINDGSDPTTTSGNYVSCGNGIGLIDVARDTGPAGAFVVYTLPVNANGYNLTNISVYGGWADAGRDAQAYTVYYSTVASPTVFHALTSVAYNPVNPNNGASVNRSTIIPATGSLVTNVAAVKFDFTSPGSENGFVGYAEITVSGFPSTTTASDPIITTENQNTDSPTWVVETNSLIEGKLPSSVVASGSFAGGFPSEQGTEGLPALTDGTFGPAASVSGLGSTNFATCGGDVRVGQSVTYMTAGWNVTNIVVYSGWGNYNRDGQFYNITYSTVSAPTNFLPLASVNFDPPALTGPSANRVNIAPPAGATTFGTNIAAVKFDFSPQTGNLDNGYSGYAEIVVQGSNLTPPTPPTVAKSVMSNGNLVFTGIGGTPNFGYTVLTSTNLLTPVANWTVSATGVLDGSGAFSNAIPINVTNSPSFFRLRML